MSNQPNIHFFYSRETGQLVDFRTAKGWLTPNERGLIHKLAGEAPPSLWMVNVGIEYGASLVCMRQGNDAAPILAVDVIGDSKIDTTIPAPVVFVKGDSTLAGQVLQPERAGLVFVDGGHDYRTVQLDAVLYSGMVWVGGHILFHDTDLSPAQEDVNRAVQEWFDRWGHGPFIEQPKVDSIRWFTRVASR